MEISTLIRVKPRRYNGPRDYIKLFLVGLPEIFLLKFSASIQRIIPFFYNIYKFTMHS